MNILQPDLFLRRAADVTPALLQQFAVRGLILDVDNTLAPDKAPLPLPGLEDWIGLMRDRGIRLMILSNGSAGRVAPFAEKLGLPFISRAAKPLCFGYRRAMRALRLPRRQVAVVGDQIFTDVLGANLAGLRSFLVEPFHPESGWSFRLRRRLEAPVIRKYHRLAPGGKTADPRVSPEERRKP